MEIFINEVKSQIHRKVKFVKSNRVGEYFEKYDETRQHLSPSNKFLEKYGICVQNTMLGTLQQSGVSKR